MFTRERLDRYSRQIILPGVGGEGQAALLNARVLVIGAGGLGSPALLYLAAAGVGTIGIVDDDSVDLSNLQRQVLHSTAAIGTPKTASAAARLKGLNPDVSVDEHRVRLSSANARELIGAYDLVLDGSDNFPTRYLVNDACYLEGKPLIYGALSQFEGQVSLFGLLARDRQRGLSAAFPSTLPAQATRSVAPEGGRRGPCYRCLFPVPPPPGTVPNCAEAGVLGVLPAVVGSLMASEALKLLLGLGEPLSGRLLLVDMLEPGTQVISLERDPACPLCGERPSLTELVDYEAFCGLPG